jgi:peptide deformylase
MRSFLMAVREILCFPDPRLRAVAERVNSFEGGLRSLADDLLETMRAAPGIGMTAPHIGVPRRLVVIELPGEAVRFYVNPQIDWVSTEMVRHAEGSVSMPGVTDDVERPARIRLRYQDLAGHEEVAEATGLLAVCLQHEIDQLDGIFWLYRLSRLRRERLIKRFGKQRPSS